MNDYTNSHDCGHDHQQREEPSRRTVMKYLVGLSLAALASVLAPGIVKAGNGRCGVSGCNCPAFAGTQNLCGNCGHQWSDHWN
jgi:hypothetical protein